MAVVNSWSNNNFDYNLSFGATSMTFPNLDGNGNTASNNLEDVDPMFENLPLASTHVLTYDPNLKVGSMAIGAGEGGIDMGVFGGGTPFSLSGSTTPIVQSLSVPGNVLQGNDLPVQIKAIGN